MDSLIKRDTKDLYNKVKNLTGVDGDWEEPFQSDLTVYTDKDSIEESTRQILSYLEYREVL